MTTGRANPTHDSPPHADGGLFSADTTPTAGGASGPRVPGEHADRDGLGPLIDALEAQETRLGALHALACRQAEVFAGDDADAIIRLVRERDGVMAGVNELASRVDDARAVLASNQGVAGEGRAAVERLVGRIEALAQQITERDRADGADLVSRRDELGTKLRGVGASRSAIGAYAYHRPDVASFQDVRG